MLPVWLPLAACLVPPHPGVLPANERPALSGPEQLRATADGHFLIHYTLEGVDTPGETADVNPANGIPDTVDWIEEALALTDAAFVEGDGWPRPVADEGVGGDDRLDVYVRDIDAFGYAHYQVLDSGTLVCYVELDPALASGGPELYTGVAGHEYHHCLQMTVGRTHDWIHEATSTWAQYLLFDEGGFVEAARLALWRTRLRGAGLAIDTLGDRFEYAGMVWVKYLVDRGGGERARVLDLWQAMAAAGGWEAGHREVLPAVFGVASLEEAASEHAEWNWFACRRDDGRHYDPATLPCDGDIEVRATAVPAPPASGTSEPIGRLGSAYLDVTPDCATADLQLTVRPSADLRVRLLEVAPGEESPVTVRDVAGGVTGTLTVPDWNWRGRVVLVATSVAEEGATFEWTAAASGTMRAPATLPPVAGLDVAPVEPIVLGVGETATLAASALYGTCSDGRDVTGEVEWRSADEGVATVEDGVVTGRGAGMTEVWAVAGQVSSVRVAVEVAGAAADGCGCRTAGRRGSRSGAGALLGAGVLALLARIRGRPARRRPPPTGSRLPGPRRAGRA